MQWMWWYKSTVVHRPHPRQPLCNMREAIATDRHPPYNQVNGGDMM